MSIFLKIEELERIRNSKVIVLGAANIDIDFLPPLFDVLREIGHCITLDLLIYCRGGDVNAARRLALLLHDFTDDLRFIVPHYCESAATIMALAARQIVTGPVAVFSPIDPLLGTAAAFRENQPLAVSSQDVRLFGKMSQEWFGLAEPEARSRALPLLCESIFPTTLTSFYRCTLELQEIGKQLLSLHMRDREPEELARIIDTLIFGYHSHTYALTGDEMLALGLPVVADSSIETVAWTMASMIRERIGPEARLTSESINCDAVLLTRNGGMARRRTPDAPIACWEAIQSHA